MNKILKEIGVYILIFAFSVGLLLSLLLLSGKISRNSIRKNMESSAEKLCEREVFFRAIKGVEASIVDRYADSIILNIAWCLDEEKPLESVIWSSYYYTSEVNENENLKEAVFHDKAANKQYLRYWHGSVACVKLFLLLTDIKGIYFINGVLLVVLFIALITMLIKRKAYDLALAFFIGAVLVNSWVVPLSLEYTWVFIIMLFMSILILKTYEKENELLLCALFLFTGIITNYLDFLTSETLTLLVPLIIIMYFRLKKNGDHLFKTELLYAIKKAVLWGVGYAGMWISKWVIASLVIGENSFKYVREHIDERIGGDIGDRTLIGYIVGAIGKNIFKLVPACFGNVGMIIFGIVIFALIYICYVYKKKQVAWGKVGLYLLIGLIPYVRYAVLHEHAYLHNFFTCRAQLATVIAVILSVNEIVEWRYLENAVKRKK
ncbi:MAG: hypothetical protein IKQ71_00750 [Lachnospiraceae bacterium]|nr:hypothetical protein [Lachnospiraceae bacterium]